MITINKTESGFNVFFPFELKDSFKSTFKTAKWDAGQRCWKIGIRSGKKLEKWIELVSQVVNDMIESDAEEMTAREIEAVQAEIKEIQEKIHEERQARKKYASCEKLKEAKDKIEIAKQEYKEELNAAMSERSNAEKMLGEVCDLCEIRKAHIDMKSVYKKTSGLYKRQNRERFNNACEVMSDQNDKLKKIGFYSVGLRELSFMNFNRPDRDNPFSLKYSDIFDLKKWEDEE